jgi:BirA family biotin operon repressor/biotin-[acetyl-CoA-carboxylase] ligase
LIAETQTAGRGRFDRKWFSPEFENLYFSILLIEKPLRPNFEILMAVSNSILKTLKNYNIETFIKWPNDIILNNKKLAGILIENKYKAKELEFTVVGIGLNVNTDFSKVEELKDFAISLSQYLGREIEKENILFDFLEKFELEYKLDKKNLYNFYKANLYKLNEFIKLKYKDEIYNGIFLNVTEDGILQLVTEEGKLNFDIGEIMF